MPSYVVKPDPERDFYVMWSTVVDNVTWCGTRADFLSHEDVDEERMARADERGTSAFDGYYGWTDRRFLVHNMPGAPGLLPREQLIPFSLLMVEGREDEAAAMLEELTDA